MIRNKLFPWLKRQRRRYGRHKRLYVHDGEDTASRLRMNMKSRYEFINRSRGKDQLVIIVAGYNDELWRLVLPRVAAFTDPESCDVVVVPGTDSEALRSACTTHKWSFLRTEENRLALAQNLAIADHPSAQPIAKLDEDIIVSDRWLERLVETREGVEADGRFDIGIVAPTLNVNGFTYRLLLERAGVLAEYEARFGPARQSCMNTPIWDSTEAAAFMWSLLELFDDSVRKLQTEGPEYSACPHRFSIGCFLIHRQMWEEMGGFTVAKDGVLGVEEVDLGVYCMAESRVIVIAHNAVVGHVAFGSQTEGMMRIIAGRADLGLER